MPHDFKNFPELSERQMASYYFESPHKQIFEDFEAKVIKVIDGDTIKVQTDFRDFTFRIRFANTAAPEKKEAGGLESKSWLQEQIEGEEVEVIIDRKNRVGKWGRLIGTIMHKGININEETVRTGHATTWENRKKNTIPDFDKSMEAIQNGFKF